MAVYEKDAKPLASMSKHRTAFLRAWINLMQAGLSTDATERAAQLARVEERFKESNKALEDLTGEVKSTSLAKSAEESAAIYHQLVRGMTEASDTIRKGNSEAALKSINGDLDKQRREHGKLNDEFSKKLEESASQRSEDNSKQADGVIRTSTIIVALSALLAVIVGFVLFRNTSISIRRVHEEAERLAVAAVGGELKTRGDSESVDLEFRGIVDGVNRTLDAVINPLNVAATYVDKISKGEIPPKITDTYNGDFNNIKNNLNQCIDAVNALVADANILSKAAVEGKLATRADASRHNGDFRKIVQGVNDTLDAVIGPLNVAAKYVDNISKGNIPSKITDSYNGDFNNIKNNLNQCIDAVNTLVADAGVLSKAAVEGKLATRADASKHQGDFRKIVQGVDDTLDAVIGPLTVAANYVDLISKGDIPSKITDRYNGDFNAIKNNLNVLIEAMERVTRALQEIASGNLQVATCKSR
jgi:methyl-accepting chemotaxis protein